MEEVTTTQGEVKTGLPTSQTFYLPLVRAAKNKWVPGLPVLSPQKALDNLIERTDVSENCAIVKFDLPL